MYICDTFDLGSIVRKGSAHLWFGTGRKYRYLSKYILYYATFSYQLIVEYDQLISTTYLNTIT